MTTTIRLLSGELIQTEQLNLSDEQIQTFVRSICVLPEHHTVHITSHNDPITVLVTVDVPLELKLFVRYGMILAGLLFARYDPDLHTDPIHEVESYLDNIYLSRANMTWSHALPHTVKLIELIRGKWRPYLLPFTHNPFEIARRRSIIAEYISSILPEDVGLTQLIVWAVEGELFDNHLMTITDWEPLFAVVSSRLSALAPIDRDIVQQEIAQRVGDAFHTYVARDTYHSSELFARMVMACMELVGPANIEKICSHWDEVNVAANAIIDQERRHDLWFASKLFMTDHMRYMTYCG